jgi:hypothetical protein
MSEELQLQAAEVKITSDADSVTITFPKPIEWIQMPKAGAITFAIALLQQCGVSVNTTLTPAAPPPRKESELV